MRGEPTDFIRPGIVQFMVHPETMNGTGPIVERIQSIVDDAYFESIEITQIKDDAARKEVASMLAMSQMEVGFAAQPIQLGGKLDLNSPDEAERKRAVDTLTRYFPMAKELGATKFALLSGLDPGDEEREEAIAHFIDSMQQLCSKAREYDLALALEVFDREIDKKALIGSTRDAVRVAAKLRPDFPDFGLMLDLSHLPLQGEGSRESLTQAKGYITHIHVGNCVLDPNHPGYGDSHPPFGVPEGENDVDELADFLRVLLDIGYLTESEPKTVAFEVKPREGDRPEVVIANAKRTLREAWRRI